MAMTGVGDEQGVRGDHRRQRPLHAVRTELRQGAAEGRATTVGGDQNRSNLTTLLRRQSIDS